MLFRVILVQGGAGAGQCVQRRRSVLSSAQVRFKGEVLRHQKHIESRFAVQVSKVKSGLRHSLHSPAPFTPLSCAIRPTDLHQTLHQTLHRPAPDTALTCTRHCTDLLHCRRLPAPLSVIPRRSPSVSPCSLIPKIEFAACFREKENSYLKRISPRL